MEYFIVKVLSWIKYNCRPTAQGNFLLYYMQKQKKNLQRLQMK